MSQREDELDTKLEKTLLDQYKSESEERPSADVDDAILAMAKVQAEQMHKQTAAPRHVEKWPVWFSTAAVLVLGVSVSVLMSRHEERTQFDELAPMIQSSGMVFDEAVEPEEHKKKSDDQALAEKKSRQAESEKATPSARRSAEMAIREEQSIAPAAVSETQQPMAPARSMPKAEPKKRKEAMMADTSESEQLRIRIAGVWVYMEIEGGFCGIETQDGKKYLPLNPPQDCREKEGSKIEVDAIVQQDIATIQMWGVPVRLIVTEKE